MSAKKILIVDDDPIILFLHEAILKDLVPDLQIITFDSAYSAEAYILAHQKDSFLLFLDINMPVMDGWAFLDALGIAGQLDIVVIMATSSVNESDRVRAAQHLMVQGMLIKPLKPDLLDCTHEGELIRRFVYDS